MHPSAMANGKLFFDTYAGSFVSNNTKIIDIGSQNVNGSLRDVAPSNFEYVGIDFVKGNGVDVILEDPYKYPIEDNSVDIVVSSSCFEHSEMFWISFLEVMRILKPNGLFYLNAPSAGYYHTYPVDCWRFFPDSGKALVTWAKRNSINATLLESYITLQTNTHPYIDPWQDNVSVFLKDASFIESHPNRINKIEHMKQFISNVYLG